MLLCHVQTVANRVGGWFYILGRGKESGARTSGRRRGSCAQGERHFTAVSVAFRRVEARRQRDPGFDRELGKIERELS